MKILQIVTQMEAAGAQRVAYLLGEELRNNGCDAELLFLYIKRPAYNSMRGVSSLLDHKPSFIDYLRIVILLGRHLLRNKPDVLITHTHFANILGQAMGFVCGVHNRIAVNHSPDTVYCRWARRVDTFLGSVGVYSKIVAVSDSVVTSFSDYPRLYKRRIRVINNGVSVGAESGMSPELRAALGIPLTAPFIANVGRMSPQKNQILLIRLLALVPSLHLVIIGEGEERRTLVEIAESLSVASRVHLTGELMPTDAFSIVRASDIFVFPSRVEAMPMALIEAMLLEKPIVASDIPACTEFLGEAGVLLPIDQPEAWRSAIEQLLTEPIKARLLGQRAREKALRFTPEHMGESYLDLIERREICHSAAVSMP